MSFLSGATLAAPAGDGPGNPWVSWRYVHDNAGEILSALQYHAGLTARAVIIAWVIALPLAVAAFRVRPLAGPVLAVSGALHAIPALALLALLTSSVGTTTDTAVLLALVGYALLVLVRNALTALRQVPADVRDAAAGMGYGRFGQLWRIELPLALPGLVTGLRLATVSTVALVTVGGVIGHGGLGDLLLGGFRAGSPRAEILTASALCVLLALVLDLALAGLGRLLTPWIERQRA